MESQYSISSKKYFYLLISLIAYFLINSILISYKTNIYFFDILFLIVICLCIYSVANKLWITCVTIPLGCISIITHWMLNIANLPIKAIIFIHSLSNVLFLSLVTCCILTAVAQKRKVTREILFGAVCSYFLIGLLWASIYQVIATLNPAAFSFLAPNAVFHSISVEPIRAQAQYYIYFSFVTLTTLGYGDILPVSDVAKTFGWLEAMTGQIFLVVWISQLVSLYVIEKQKEQTNESSS